MRRGAKAVAWGVLAGLAIAEAQDKPATYFKSRLESLERLTDTFDPIVANALQIAAAIGTFQGGDPPSKAMDTEHWSADDAVPMVADLPLHWNSSSKKFEVRQDQLANSSEAKLIFTWRFLRAYDKLADDLRESGSVLAMGMAALVASESSYRTNWAYLPLELHDATAFVHLLSLRDKGLLQASFGGARDRRDAAITQAMRQLCPDELSSSAIVDQLQSESLFGAALPPKEGPARIATKLTQLRKACSQQLSPAEIDGINNLTLRALVLEAGPSESSEKPFECVGTSWGCRFEKLLAELAAQQQGNVRDSKGLAPDIRKGLGPVRTDPTILVPLMIAAGRFALAPRKDEIKDLTQKLRAGNTDAVDELKQVVEKALRDHKEGTNKILDLAGSPPIFEVNRDQGRVSAMLVWRNIARLEPKPGDTWPHTEMVFVELQDFEAGPDTPNAPIKGKGGPQPIEPGPASPDSPSDGLGKVRKGSPVPGPVADRQGGPGPGPGPGPNPGWNRGTATPPDTAPASKVWDPVIPELTLREDPISIPDDGRRELRDRSQALRTTFLQTVAIGLPAGSRLLDYLNPEGWRERPDLRTWLESALDGFLAEREQFLEMQGGPYASILRKVLRDGFYVAAWLHETGATATSAVLLRDLIELSVYAGCEQGKQARLGRLDLPLTLAFPALIRGQQSDDLQEWMTLGEAPRRVIAYMGNHFTDGERVSLADLYTLWTSGKEWTSDPTPNIEDLPVLGAQERSKGCAQGRLCEWFFHGRTSLAFFQRKQ